jgi:hypothetical protein
MCAEHDVRERAELAGRRQRFSFEYVKGGTCKPSAPERMDKRFFFRYRAPRDIHKISV